MQEEKYDYIVVGSGSGGAVVASRLSEGGEFRVLCIEAGKRDHRYIWTRSPLGIAFMIEDENVNWCDRSEPNETHGNRSLYVAHGKILGGSSAINGTVFNRGQRGDYDGWAALGCKGWAYQDVLPFFKKLESSPVGSDEYRGRNGPIKVSVAKKLAPVYDLFVSAAEAIGIPTNPDYCGANQVGVALAQQAVHRGRRQSTATQYLHPASKRKNLTIVRGAEVTSLIMEKTTCVGVRYIRGGKVQEALAEREVILSGGAINSPKILELSGIGDPSVLRRHGVPIVKSLPGVGKNLRDHYGATLKWSLSKPGASLSDRGRGWKLAFEVLRYALLGHGFIGQGFGTLRVFTRSHPDTEDSDIQMVVAPYMIELNNGQQSLSPVNGFTIYAQGQRPESTGTVHIQSRDPSIPPAITYRFLDTDLDRMIAVEAVRQARQIVNAPPLKSAVAKELAPGPGVQSDEEIIEYIRNTGRTTYHFVGTCKMGNDTLSVVDERLRVIGIERLRIADASIMPTLVSGNTSIPTIMIGEKCAAMIIEDALNPRNDI